MAVSRMNLSRLSRLRFKRRIATYVNIGLICLAPVLALVTYLVLGPIDQGRESNLLRVILLCDLLYLCLLYTSPSPRDKRQSRMPSSA